MYRFIRTALLCNAADIPAALQFAAEVTAHLNRTYGLNMKAGIELFGRPRLHWHDDVSSVDAMTAVNQKLMTDATYQALLVKNNHLWLQGGMKDRLVSLIG
jgi:hypothetical protein